MVDICDASENHPIYIEGGMEGDDFKGFTYVRCNIPGPGYDISMLEEELLGCSCQSSCDLSDGSTCVCVNQFGPSYSKEGKLLQMDANSSRPVLECSQRCQCSSTCHNRVVQKGLKYKLQVFRDVQKGFCLRTLEPIECGSFVCEYAGELLTDAEAKKRAIQQTDVDMNYMFVLQEHCSTEINRTIVDPCSRGNIGRFLSHSCEPNLIMVPVRIATPVPHLCLFARRDVMAGEELAYDYGGQRNAETTDTTHVLSSGEDKPKLKECHCRSLYCRGYLPYDVSVI